MNPGGALDFLTSIIAAFYLGVVLWNGRALDLLTLLMQEAGFLQLVIAAFVVWQLAALPYIGPLVEGIVGLAFVALFLKIIPGLRIAFDDFYNGRISLFGLVARAANVNSQTE